MGILEDVLKELDGALERVQIKREPYDLFINEEDFPFSDGRTLMFLDGQFVLVDYQRGTLRNKKVFDKNDRKQLLYNLLKPILISKASSQASLSKDFYSQTFLENQFKLFSKISIEYALWRKQEISEILKRYPD